MMDFVNFFQPGLWIKIITLIAIGFYVVFTFVVFTQVKVMGQILSFPNAKIILRAISIVKIIFAISLFLGSFVIL